MIERMVKASELRLGNLVNDPKVWGEMIVESVFGSTNRAFLHTPDKEYLADCSLETIEPIEITEEWLIKFGFNNISDLHPTFQKNPYLVEEGLMREGKYYFRQIINKEDSLCINLTNPIQYVHQLQNLYFSLTGRELELTK